uniref:Beta-1,4-glucuronyltransferase 1 n=1 Tax=Phallusia mammillata TaxID=59560 RepID=A0A6F9D7Y1_9ASCI|nr:N-acetyllactosaminide beta-1,3-N-acetylglucosaminyltransferase [Phallusia mammillata]
MTVQRLLQGSFMVKRKCSWNKITVALLVVFLLVGYLQAQLNRSLVRLQKEFLQFRLGQAEEWGEYMVVWNTLSVAAVKKNTTSKDDDVTLVTQCSVNNLHYLIQTNWHWYGPISVALFVPGPHALQAYFGVKYMKKCHKLHRIQFHFVYPRDRPPVFDADIFQLWFKFITPKVDCNRFLEVLRNFTASNYAHGDLQYPQNTLRNVAKSASQTKYVFVLDVDVMPSRDTRAQFVKFLSESEFQELRHPAVFVAPAFEIENRTPMPLSKTQLVHALKQDVVRPFHIETCPKCHKATLYDDWMAITRTANITTAFELAWAISWEPFYIGLIDVPDYDERFKQYGFDRISHTCELYMAGYHFHLLAHAFVVHAGYKRPGEFHLRKEQENRRNWMLFEKVFVPEMVRKYNSNGKTCLGSNRRQGKAKVSVQNHLKMSSKKKKLKADINEEL